MHTKQIIVIRKDLKMRRGKEIAQCCHASMAFLTQDGEIVLDSEYIHYGGELPQWQFRNNLYQVDSVISEIQHWLKNSFRKICCYVNSEEELLDIYNKAKEKGLIVHLIEDNGTTEFNNIKTKTCLAIGPHSDEKFVGVTDNLTLY